MSSDYIYQLNRNPYMPLLKSNYKPTGWRKNGQLQTMFPNFFRKVNFEFNKRERLNLPDGDFLDLDWKKNNNSNLVILGHGLEGSSHSSYILGMAKYFSERGYDVLAWNHRSCSGEMNRNLRFYHHGVTDDLHEVVKHCSLYKNVHVVGFSLGGNLVLKYVGEEHFEKPNNVRAFVAFSVPVDLLDCVNEIHKPKNRIYVINFLNTLKKKVKEKAKSPHLDLNTENLKQVKSLLDFDNLYTAPIHGFENAHDYYERASSKQFLPNIKVPSLLVNAINDPMLGQKCHPTEVAEKHDKFYFMKTAHGGHCGFVPNKGDVYWSEEVTFDFVKQWEV